MRKSMSMTLGGLALVVSASVAADYPERDVRMIVPWGAGGGTDGIVRKISNLAEEPLGGTVYVENIEGGMSANGLVQALGARPDGYTLIALTYDSVVTIPWQGMLAGYDIDAFAKPDAPGVYVGEAKIGSIGLRVRQGTSYHGLALNVDMDLEPFSRIDPCGYHGLAMTQVSALGGPASLDVVADDLSTQLCRTLNVRAAEHLGALPI